MKKVIILTGQTATGKTKLALSLAKKVNGELINYDSRQIYKYLDIVTGKDVKNIHLCDIIDPKKYFSSFDYVKNAVPVIKKILKNNKTPIIVGGTYLYVKHLLYGFETEGIKPDWELRSILQQKTVAELASELKSIDKNIFEAMNTSDRNNPRRLMRKIEIAKKNYDLRIKNYEFYKRINPLFKNFEIKFIGLKFKNRETLINRIRKRVFKRLKQGAIEEVRELLKKGYVQNDPGLQTIGYQQIIRFLNGNISKDQAITEWITKETQYAKRQYTFMKKDPNISWKEISF